MPPLPGPGPAVPAPPPPARRARRRWRHRRLLAPGLTHSLTDGTEERADETPNQHKRTTLGSLGYTEEFTAWGSEAAPPEPPVSKRHWGKYRGIVVDNQDIPPRGRLLVSVPGIVITNWALPCLPVASIESGTFMRPQIGSNVWVEFERGDPDKPVWAGCFWGEGEIPPIAEEDTPSGGYVMSMVTCSRASSSPTSRFRSAGPTPRERGHHLGRGSGDDLDDPGRNHHLSSGRDDHHRHRVHRDHPANFTVAIRWSTSHFHITSMTADGQRQRAMTTTSGRCSSCCCSRGRANVSTSRLSAAGCSTRCSRRTPRRSRRRSM